MTIILDRMAACPSARRLPGSPASRSGGVARPAPRRRTTTTTATTSTTTTTTTTTNYDNNEHDNIDNKHNEHTHNRKQQDTAGHRVASRLGRLAPLALLRDLRSETRCMHKYYDHE